MALDDIARSCDSRFLEPDGGGEHIVLCPFQSFARLAQPSYVIT